jgi:hypothetical protein
MGKAAALHSFFFRQLSIFLFLKICLYLTILVYGATIVAVPTSYKAVSAGRVDVKTNLVGQDRGFSKASSTITAAGTSCGVGTQVNFSVVASRANTAITAGDIVYDLQVNTTASTPNTTCWTVSLVYTPSGGSQTSAGSVFIGTTVAVAGQTIDCKFDLGASLPTPPFTFQVSVI